MSIGKAPLPNPFAQTVKRTQLVVDEFLLMDEILKFQLHEAL
jgi:hypothetical protein